MTNRKVLFGLIIIAFAAVGAYFAIDYVAKKEIKLAVDKYQSDYMPDYLNDYIEINYDAGVSGLFVPTIKNLKINICLLYTSPSPRDATLSRMPSSA